MKQTQALLSAIDSGKALRPLVLFVLLFLPPLLSAQGIPDADLFFIPETSQTTNRKDTLSVNEAAYDDARNNMTDEQKDALMTKKRELYELYDDYVRRDQFDSALDELDRYVEAIRQLYSSKEPVYRLALSDAFLQMGRCYEGLGNNVQSVLFWQRVLWQFKGTEGATKAAFFWGRVNYRLFIGEIPANRNLPAPKKDVVLKRLAYAIEVAPQADGAADLMLWAADVCIRTKDWDKAKEHLKSLREKFPRSDAADKIDEYAQRIPQE